MFIFINKLFFSQTNTSCPVCRRQIKGYSTWEKPKTDEWNSNGPCGQWQIQTSAFRRKVYARNVWVQDLSDVCEGYREFTPEFYRYVDLTETQCLFNID